MWNGSLLELVLLKRPPWSMMPLKVLCGLAVLMWPGTGLMSEACVATEGHTDVHPWSMMQPEAMLVSMGRAVTGVPINVSGLCFHLSLGCL